MGAFLNQALPRMLPEGCTFTVYPFQGKPDLLRKLEDRLRGYARWLPPGYRIIVLVDRDQQDCHDLKHKLESAVAGAELRSRRRSVAGDWQIVTRVVIEELEAWYFGDWQAVKGAYPRVRDSVAPRYRNSDAIAGGTAEAFERVLKAAGYFKGGLRKVEAARAIGPHIVPHRNTSPSFAMFRDAVLEATG